MKKIIFILAATLMFVTGCYKAKAQSTAHCDSVKLTVNQIVDLWGDRNVPDSCGLRETFGSFTQKSTIAGKQFALPFYPTATTLAPSNGFSVVPFRNIFMLHRLWELRVDSISAVITGKGGTGVIMDFNDANGGNGRGAWGVYDDGGLITDEFMLIDSVSHTTELGNKKAEFTLFNTTANKTDTINDGRLTANRTHYNPDSTGTYALLVNVPTYYFQGVAVGGGNGSGIRIETDSVGVIGTTATFNLTVDNVGGGTALFGTLYSVTANTRGGAVGNTILSIAADKKSVKVTTGAGAAECYLTVIGK